MRKKNDKNLTVDKERTVSTKCAALVLAVNLGSNTAAQWKDQDVSVC